MNEVETLDLNLITVGVIANTHGLRGDVKVLPRTDFPQKRFCKGSILHLRQPGQPVSKVLEVLEGKPHQQFWLVRFVDHTSINDVERYKGMELCVESDQLAKLPADTYYVHQLVGLRVLDENERDLGTITDVLMPGANDVYVVHQNGRKDDLLLPAIPDCILGVDLDQQIMHVHLLPGLLEDEPEA